VAKKRQQQDQPEANANDVFFQTVSRAAVRLKMEVTRLFPLSANPTPSAGHRPRMRRIFIFSIR
jgi:hypothetical protein